MKPGNGNWRDRPTESNNRNSMTTTHKYGMMTDKEGALIDDLLLDIKNKFGEIRFLEIGTCGGGTTRGVYQRAAELGCPVHCEGVDNVAGYCMADPPADYIFHAGDSMDMWSKIQGRDFNLLFVDGCHCLNHAMCDFLNYSPFVAVGGFPGAQAIYNLAKQSKFQP